MEITVVNSNGGLVTNKLVNLDDQIQPLYSDTMDHTKSDEIYLTLRDEVLDPEKTYAYYGISGPVTLFYTKNGKMITLGFVNSSVFFRDFYSGKAGDYWFESRTKFARALPAHCAFCTNPVYMTIIDKSPHYGDLCREHVPHIPLHYQHIRGYVDTLSKKNYTFDTDTNSWQLVV